MAGHDVPYLEDRVRVVRCLVHHQKSRELAHEVWIVHDWTGISVGEGRDRSPHAVETNQRSNCFVIPVQRGERVVMPRQGFDIGERID